MRTLVSFAAAAVLAAMTLAQPAPAGAATLFGTDLNTAQLVTIDPTTGAATAVGALGFGGEIGLAFAADGTLFGTDTNTDQLLTIDPTTGAATAVGALGFFQVVGLAFAADGTLFGTTIDTDQLLTIDPTTGAATAVGALGFDGVVGLAFQPEPPVAPIPLPPALPLFATGLAALGLAAWRRRRKAASA